MGKKISQVKRGKICKKSTGEKKQVVDNHFIKLLRPKVYITDSSSFKRLVQELTGNGTPAPESPEYHQIPYNSPRLLVLEEDIVAPVEVDIGNSGMDSLSAFVDDAVFDDHMNFPCFEPFSHLGSESIGFGDHLDESWFVEAENFCYEIDYGLPHEVSIYDYELSGLI